MFNENEMKGQEKAGFLFAKRVNELGMCLVELNSFSKDMPGSKFTIGMNKFIISAATASKAGVANG